MQAASKQCILLISISQMYPLGALALHLQSPWRSLCSGPTTVWISDLVSLKGELPFLHFICLWELKCCALVSNFFLSVHLALLPFLMTVIRNPAVTSSHHCHQQPDTPSPLEGATKPCQWLGFSHLAHFTCSQTDLHKQILEIITLKTKAAETGGRTSHTP